MGDMNITSLTNDTITLEQLGECQHFDGNIRINLAEEENLLDEDFNFLSNMISINGTLSFENFSLMDQVVIPNLSCIEGNGGTYALQVLNVYGDDIIFPNLTTITRGNVTFNITSDTCGHRGVNWSRILQDGEVITNSNCNGK